MEELFKQLTMRKRCASTDIEPARTKVSRGFRTESQIVSEWRSSLVPKGTTAWLHGLAKPPRWALLNHERVIIIEFHDIIRQYLVLRACAQDRIVVSGENLTTVKPDGTGMTVQIRAVLRRRLDLDVVKRVVSFILCERCGQACASAVSLRCRMPHPASGREVVQSFSDEMGRQFCYIKCNSCKKTDELQIILDSDGTRRYRRKGSSVCGECEGEHASFIPSFPREVSVKWNSRRLHRAEAWCKLFAVAMNDQEHSLQALIDDIPLGVANLSVCGANDQKKSNPRIGGPFPWYTLAGVTLTGLKCVKIDWQQSHGASLKLAFSPAFTPELERVTVDLEGGFLFGELSSPVLKFVSLTNCTAQAVLVNGILAPMNAVEYLSVCNFEVTGAESISVESGALAQLHVKKITGIQKIFIRAPALQKATFESCGWLQVLHGLEHSNVLQSFKLLSVSCLDELHLASNLLARLHIVGARGLRAVSVWAPNLTGLTLFDRDSLTSFHFLVRHTLRSSLPTEYCVPQLHMNLRPLGAETVVCARVIADLRRHPNRNMMM